MREVTGLVQPDAGERFAQSGTTIQFMVRAGETPPALLDAHSVDRPSAAANPQGAKKGFELSVPLARMSLIFVEEKDVQVESEWSKQATRIHGGPAVRIPVLHRGALQGDRRISVRYT
jgi:hypothetical protein